jgi:pimeloyl-ACP methyl ester carboxylesterase
VTAPPVVLLHGLAGSSERTWRETGWVDILADAGREVVPIDLPGHGPGDHPSDPAAYADFEEAVSDRLPDGPVDAVGFSLGARTLLVLAAAHPERFRRLVVAGVGAALFSPDGSSESLAARLEQGDADDPLVNHFRQLALSTEQPLEVLLAVLRRPAGPPVDAESLGRITAPTLVVLGDRDFSGPAEPLARALGGSEVVILSGVDHFATPRSFEFIDAAIRHLDDEDG